MHAVTAKQVCHRHQSDFYTKCEKKDSKTKLLKVSLNLKLQIEKCMRTYRKSTRGLFLPSGIGIGAGGADGLHWIECVKKS